MSTIGVFGGTFNPVHFGHLRSALELKQAFSLEQVRMIPCSNPPHRARPEVSAEHRLNMLRLALENARVDGLIADDRELNRPELSFTVDTLLSLTDEFPDKSLLLFVGVDAFEGFTDWSRWQRILELSGIVVMTRPGADLSEASIELLKVHGVESLRQQDGGFVGQIVQKRLTQLDISSTAIRRCIEQHNDPTFLMPAVVRDYIRKHKLYET